MSDIIKITDNQNEVVDIINGKMQVVTLYDGLQFQTGLYLTITAANCNALIIYE
jgi:hypothetical protein